MLLIIQSLIHWKPKPRKGKESNAIRKEMTKIVRFFVCNMRIPCNKNETGTLKL